MVKERIKFSLFLMAILIIYLIGVSMELKTQPVVKPQSKRPIAYVSPTPKPQVKTYSNTWGNPPPSPTSSPNLVRCELKDKSVIVITKSECTRIHDGIRAEYEKERLEREYLLSLSGQRTFDLVDAINESWALRQQYNSMILNSWEISNTPIPTYTVDLVDLPPLKIITQPSEEPDYTGTIAY